MLSLKYDSYIVSIADALAPDKPLVRLSSLRVLLIRRYLWHCFYIKDSVLHAKKSILTYELHIKKKKYKKINYCYTCKEVNFLIEK